MRAVLFILILIAVAAIVAVSTGMVSIFQTSPAQLPSVAAEDGKIRATGGNAPSFEVQTGSVGVGTQNATVAVPTVKVERSDKTVAVPALEVRPAQPANATTNAQ